jgi:hypothetical protein
VSGDVALSIGIFRENDAARSYPVYVAVAGLEFHRAAQNEAEHSLGSMVPPDLATEGGTVTNFIPLASYRLET